MKLRRLGKGGCMPCPTLPQGLEMEYLARCMNVGHAALCPTYILYNPIKHGYVTDAWNVHIDVGWAKAVVCRAQRYRRGWRWNVWHDA
jgi:hypothetical protein